MRRVSPKRARADRVPAAETRRIVLERSRGMCEGCGEQRGTDLSHRVARSRGGKWNPANIALLDAACHRWAHANPELARGKGWHLETNRVPVTAPFLYRGRWVYLDDEGNIDPIRRPLRTETA